LPRVPTSGSQGGRRAFARALTILGLVPIATGVYGIAFGASGLEGASGAAANVDNELRFLYAFWVGYGAAIVYVGLRAPENRAAVTAIGVVLFAAGVARAISWVAEGRPDTFYVVLMALELAIPPVLILWQRSVFRATTGP
jgi:Domain of unknown function (DUF4345)